MPFDMKTRRERLSRLTLVIDDDTLNLGYRRSRMTPASLRELAEIGAKTKSDIAAATAKIEESDDEAATAEGVEKAAAVLDELSGTIVRLFLDTVAEWDVTDDGVPVPLTPEGLDNIDTDLLTFILEKVREDQNPNPPTASG